MNVLGKASPSRTFDLDPRPLPNLIPFIHVWLKTPAHSDPSGWILVAVRGVGLLPLEDSAGSFGVTLGTALATY